MIRTENDLRTMYADQPDAENLEQRVLEWIDRPREVERSTRVSWAIAAAAAATLAALTAGVVMMVPRGADHYSAGATGGATPGVSAPAPVVSATTPNIKFAGFTKSGKLIPATKRELAGPLTGQLLGGSQYSLAADAGHLVVLNFFATWCGPCESQSPALQALSRQRAASGVKFVGVDVKDGSPGASRAWLAEKGITFPIIWDQPGGTAATLGKLPIVGLPMTVLVDKQQRIAAVYSGMVPTSSIAGALDQLAAEAEGSR